MERLLQPTTVIQRDSRALNRFFTVLAALVALAMFVAAAGSGSGQAAEPLPGWVDVAVNIVSALIGVLVLLPRTRLAGSVLAVLNMVLSMVVNYNVDGVTYFAQVIPFNVATIFVAALLIGHYVEDARDLPRSARG